MVEHESCIFSVTTGQQFESASYASYLSYYSFTPLGDAYFCLNLLL
jgi:hypothetical protein